MTANPELLSTVTHAPRVLELTYKGETEREKERRSDSNKYIMHYALGRQ